MNQNDFVSYLQFLPLPMFLLYARIFGFTDQAWQGAFITAGVFALGVTAFLLFQGVTLARLMLGVNLFFLVGATAFLFNIMPILEFYSAYQGPAFFINILLVGIATTFFSPAGFIGAYHHDTAAVRTASYKLLAGTALCLCISFILNSYGILFSAALPFIALRTWREKLAKI